MRAWAPPAVVVLAVALSVPVATPAAASTALPALASDAAGPLFTAGLLEPGVLLERCLRLSWSGADGTTLGVSAAVAGDLAPYLDVTVQAGRGGGYDGCGDFVGTAPAWAGDLATLSGDHGAPERQAPLLPVPTAEGSATVRITMTVRDDNRSQARRAVGDLVFGLVPTPVATVPPPDAETPGDTGAPPDPDDGPSRAPGAAATDAPDGRASAGTPTAAPTPADDPTSTPAPDEQVPAGPAPQDDDGTTVTVPLSPGAPPASPAGPAGAGLVAAVQRLLETTGVAAGAVTRAVGWTFWSAPMVLLFLLVQNRIDARDPKLAEAPAQAVPGLAFDETYGTGTVTPRASRPEGVAR